MTQAESGALEADYEFARQFLAAAVARAYFSTLLRPRTAAHQVDDGQYGLVTGGTGWI